MTTKSNISPRKRKLCDFSEETVTVLVGPVVKSYTVHPTILTNHSRFFRAIFSDHAFKESYEKLARLPEVDAGVFQIYVTYVYSGNIVVSKYGGEEVYSNDNDPEGVKRFQILIQLYSLANYLQDSNLKNKINDYLMGPNEVPALCPSTAIINLAFATNPIESTLCQLLIDTSLYSCDPAILKDEWYHLPEGFIRGLSLGWAEASWNKGTTIEKPSTVARCKYHEHDEEILADENGTCGLRGVAKTTPKKKGRKPRTEEDESTGACALLLRSSTRV